MSLTIEQVNKIAKLVKLDITGQEEKLAKMLEQTLDYIKILDELDTSGVDETYQVNGLTNVFQDENFPHNTLEPKKALQNAKDTNGDLFATKGVFDR